MNKEDNKMENLARKLEKYSYQDLLDMDDEKRYEIIDGDIYQMSSPSVVHQMIATEITRQIANYLEGKKCKVFAAPLDVRFSKEKDFKKVFDVVEPDIFIVCDEEKIDKNGICGVPDTIIEIVSPSSATRDKLLKFNLYQRKGVKEYIIIDPKERLIFPYRINKDGIYTISKIYSLEEPVKIETLKNCKIELEKFLEENKNLF